MVQTDLSNEGHWYPPPPLSFTHLSALKAEPLPPSPAFLFEQVAFENFKHTLLFPRSAAQQFRLCSWLFCLCSQGLRSCIAGFLGDGRKAG